MECVRCGCPDLVTVAPTRRYWTFLWLVFSRYSGALLVCANCGCEQRVYSGGVRQTLKGPQAQPRATAEANGDAGTHAPDRKPVPTVMRDTDQRWKR